MAPPATGKEAEVDTGVAYLEHLSAADLELLGAAAGGSTPVEDAPGYLRAHPEAVEHALASPLTFDRVFRAEPGHELALPASPFLVFAVVVHRASDELEDARFVDERLGPRLRVPVFDTSQLREFAVDPERRLFMVEHLASYTRVASGPVWVQRGNHRRRQRFSELDAAALAATLDAIPEMDRPGVYRRLGDLALFLTGVFPDHTVGRNVRPIELERLLRSLPRHEGPPLSPADIDHLAGSRGAAGLFEWLGPRWYRLAAERSPLPSVSRRLEDLATRFDQARRFLNHLTDRYLFPVRSRWFPSSNA